jgi:hypothetical protein
MPYLRGHEKWKNTRKPTPKRPNIEDMNEEERLALLKNCTIVDGDHRRGASLHIQQTNGYIFSLGRNSWYFHVFTFSETVHWFCQLVHPFDLNRAEFMPAEHFQIFSGITNEVNTYANKPVTWTERVDTLSKALIVDPSLMDRVDRNKYLQVEIQQF